MIELSPADRLTLVNDIASRAGKASEIAKWYGATVAELKAFTEDHRAEIEDARDRLETAALTANYESKSGKLTNLEPTPKELDELWLTKKTARLNRMEEVADVLYRDIMHGNLAGTELATAVREFRSYLQAAANELGQLMHRGAGEANPDDTMSLQFNGVDLDNLR